MKKTFDWSNFELAITHLIQEGFPKCMLMEFRVVVEKAVKDGRLKATKLADFDYLISK